MRPQAERLARRNKRTKPIAPPRPRFIFLHLPSVALNPVRADEVEEGADHENDRQREERHRVVEGADQGEDQRQDTAGTEEDQPDKPHVTGLFEELLLVHSGREHLVVQLAVRSKHVAHCKTSFRVLSTTNQFIPY